MTSFESSVNPIILLDVSMRVVIVCLLSIVAVHCHQDIVTHPSNLEEDDDEENETIPDGLAVDGTAHEAVLLGLTPEEMELRTASMEGNLDVVKKLVEEGVDVNQVDKLVSAQ